VTIDSTPDGELAEVRAKIAAFTTARARPTLLETIRVERGAPVRLSRHLARMAESADYFGQPFDATFAEELLRGESRKHQTLELARARLVLAPDGALRATIESFADEAPADVPRPVSIALRAVDRGDVMLYHKTTSRGVYDAALADAPDSFDVVLWNAEGEVTELTRGNLVVELDGAQWTPPQECGLLAGTLRAELLENGTLRERILTLEDVARASRLWFINSLRGRISVMLETDAS
jgi:para-aminobenzoate synthetase/4-amino-4-deoxychorismate lyase